ncbi:MAG: AAA domain-containing protein [Raineya sp.]
MASEISKSIISEQIRALQIEKQEDINLYTKQILETPLAERRNKGTTWYPIQITQIDYTLGGQLRLQIVCESVRSQQFQVGMPVVLFSNQENPEKDRLKGIVQQIQSQTMRIVFATDEPPDWLEEGKLGVDMLFDETSYLAMEQALQSVQKAENNRLAELREILLGVKKAQFEENQIILQIPELNFSQNQAIEKVLRAKDVAIIHGPPGTGKTTTLVQAILLTLKAEKQILVCTASNLALDWIVEKLQEKQTQVLRIGNPIRVSDNVLKSTLEYKVFNHSQYKQIKQLRKQADEYWSLSKKYKRNFGATEREQRKLLMQEARQISKEANALEEFILTDVLDKTQVVAATLVGASNPILAKRHFQTVFIDEASQALDPALWIAISKAQRVILAGDHCQLPPTVKSLEAEKLGLGKTVFEKLIQKQPHTATMLQVQYRMNKQIMDFSNQKFYEGKLTADESVKNTTFGEEEPVFTFVDTAGCSFDEQTDAETQSLYNPEEARLLIKILEDFLTKYEAKTSVISPYKAQVNYLKELLRHLPHVRVGTVDSFQGQESEAVFISLVRSNEKNEIGFLTDTRRLNVALTRAQKKLLVIGDSATLAKNAFFQDFFEYVEKQNAYQSAWEWL